ncbi:MAG: DUF2070 family protein [Candidatus Natronoplasma sp.]
MDDTVLISERGSRSLLFRLPSLKIQIPIIAMLSLLFVLNLPLTTSTYLFLVLVIFIPNLTSVFLLPILRDYKVNMRFRHSGIIVIVSLISTLIMYFILSYVGVAFQRAVLISIAFPISFRYLGIIGAFQHNPRRALIPSLIQSLLPLPFFAVFYDLTLLNLSSYLISLLLGIALVLLLIPFINRPFKKDFGRSTLEVTNILFKTLLGQKGGKSELEDFFGNHSIEADVDFTIYSFRTRTDKMNKALFVIPGFHPGPLRGLGGSRIGEILAEKINTHEEVFTFHAPSTHTLNPVSEEGCEELASSIKTILDDLDYTEIATPFLRKEDKGIMGAQRFKDDVFTNISFYPQPAEDVHASVGRIISNKGSNHDLSEVGVVDSHNSGEKKVSTVFYPTGKAKRIIELADETLKSVREKKEGKIRMGIASRKDYEKEDLGIAGEGIKVSVIEVNGQKSTQVLIDANNMEKGLRGKIQEEVEDLVDISEFHTTDTHQVNTLLHNHQPLGAKITHERLIKDIRGLLEAAILDLDPVEVSVEGGTLKDMELMGPINTNRINAVSQTIGRTMPLSIILTFSLQFILIFFIFGFLL